MRTLVEVIDGAGLGCSEDAVAELVRAVLDADGAGGAVALVCVDEPAMAELNRRYRGLDEPTDVLSFGCGDSGAGSSDRPWPELPLEDDAGGGEKACELGEVIICPGVVSRYAEEDGCEAGRQLGWTIIHGVLHLLGYDHERDEGEMRRREETLLEELGPVLIALSPSANV